MDTQFPYAGVDYSWSFQPQVVAMLVLVAGIYGWRFATVRSEGVKISAWRAVSFGAGLLAVALAMLSPIDKLAETRLFSIHMVQHLLLADIAAILLLMGLTRALLRPAVRRLHPVERKLGWIAHPVTALLAFVIALYLWHIPAMYDLTLHNAWAHTLEHAMFFSAGLAFWFYLIEPVPPRNRLSGPGSIAYLGGAKLLLAGLGIALAFSTTVFYTPYEQAPRTWGLSALEDQNIGGVLMMIEQSTVLLVFFVIVFFRMLERSERDEKRRERIEADAT